MLSNLTIKNFAIIKETSLNFDLGFNVFMGATGAGKSIIIDALNFVLGDKASKDNIRHNQNTLLVKAVFENVNNTTKALLDDFCIAQDDDLLILTRTFSIDGKSSCLINGESVTLSMLKQVGQTLVDSYCQHDSVQLLKTSNHIKLLDSNCPAVVEELKAKISELLHQIKEIYENIEKLGGSAENRQRLIDLLTYQIKEIESANLKEGEEENLRSQLSVAANAELLNSSLSQVCQMFDSANLSSACSVLNGIIKFDDRLGCLYERMNSSVLELEDIVESLKQLKNSINFDESEIDALNERLDLIKNLNKKYGGDYTSVIGFLDKANCELYDLQNCEEKLAELNKQKLDLESQLYELSFELHQHRAACAKIIEKEVKAELSCLGMKNSEFVVRFDDIPLKGQAKFNHNGFDNVEFLFSANYGEEPKPLAKIISGGELSRFMLAMKNVVKDKNGVETLIFDEIDSGISGEIGSMVAERIARLSKNVQILCITHLQQVTAMADSHFFVEKSVEGDETVSSCQKISDNEVIDYVASLSGQGVTSASIENAKELMVWANNIKSNL